MAKRAKIEKASDPKGLAHERLVDQVLLQPWFLPPRVARAIHGLVPPDFYRKMRYFFDDYGCMICGVGVGYHSNGMCRPCRSNIENKLVKSVKRHALSNPHQRLDLVLFKQERFAKKLLHRLSHAVRKGRKPPHKYNPVYEALAARYQ